jgi:prolyl oligopeptidase
MLVGLVSITAAETQAQQGARLSYPSAPEASHVDQYHGVSVPDPYRWLETPTDSTTIRWTRSQDSLARRYTKDLPGRDAIRRRLDAIRPSEAIHAPSKRGDRYFFVRRSGPPGSVVEALVMRERRDGPERVVTEPRWHGSTARFATFPGTAVPSLQVSPDGRYVAYGITEGTSLWSRWYVRDTETGRETGDT